MNKHYFINRQRGEEGPFTIDELSNMRLLSDTKVWYDGLEDWKNISEIDELCSVIIKRPPALKVDPTAKTPNPNYKTEVTGHLKVTTEKAPNPTLEAIKPTRSTLTWLIIWCGFHLFALLMSYSEIDIFNSEGRSNTDKFWPFVEFRYDVISERGRNMGPFDILSHDEAYDVGTGFYGIFTEYDLTEFAFYVGGAILLYFIIKISKKE